ncbi:MAG: hydrogenase nickel incorporation protein HypA [Candidatus Methanomethylophilaceae archaeon]|nr:hydrogenase nickel incorporation protein HypA [Candidatus Methanomethylophilaceae archaeon]
MSEDNCGCGHDHGAGKTSIEEAGGCAVGMTGKINGFNADAEERLAKALMEVGKWVESESGALLGHIKAAVVTDDGKGITLNLTNLLNGVEHHGTLAPQEKVNFTFMSAVLDVDEHELEHMMYHAIEHTALDYELDEHEHHHHDHCGCGHDHEHHHDHDDHCGCGHDHHHEHDDECCHDHDHHHDHEHHHDHDDHCGCGHDHYHEHHHEHDDECCHDHHHHDHCGHDHHHDHG